MVYLWLELMMIIHNYLVVIQGLGKLFSLERVLIMKRTDKRLHNLTGTTFYVHQ